MIAVVGAGAMGAALAAQFSRGGNESVLLATEFDRPVIQAWREGLPHPALGVVIGREVECRPPGDWSAVLPGADIVTIAVASSGLRHVLAAAARHAASNAVWLLATKGWQRETLLAPSEVAVDVLGSEARIVALAGPGIAAELVAGSPTALVSASGDAGARRTVARALTSPTTLVATTSDVAGAETSSAYKNVVAIAVGIAQGMSERFIESALVRAFANARAAMFAQGMVDMMRLAEARGGHASTVVGLAGSGDLYVTCISGRNGRFGQLLGSGATPEQALRSIGSTVEGVANTEVALELAERYSLDLPTARAVDLALHQQLTDEHGLQQLRRLFVTAMRSSSRLGARR
jgi:glycerol-3-phosphate dehydrogenase (NAD(P)+)